MTMAIDAGRRAVTIPVRAAEPGPAVDEQHDPLETGIHHTSAVEGSLHVLHNSVDIAEGLLGGVSDVMMVPAAVYFGTKYLTRDHDRGDQISTSLGLSATAATGVIFGDAGGIKHPAHGILAKYKSAFNGKLLSTIERTGKVLDVAVPASVVAVGLGESVIVVNEHGGDVNSLVTSQEGRTGVLHALGGSLLLMRAKPFQIAGIAPLLVAAANDFGAFKSLDREGEVAGLDSGGSPHVEE